MWMCISYIRHTPQSLYIFTHDVLLVMRHHECWLLACVDAFLICQVGHIHAVYSQILYTKSRKSYAIRGNNQRRVFEGTNHDSNWNALHTRCSFCERNGTRDCIFRHLRVCIFISTNNMYSAEGLQNCYLWLKDKPIYYANRHANCYAEAANHMKEMFKISVFSDGDGDTPSCNARTQKKS